MKLLQEKLMNLEVDRVLDIATGTGQFIKILKDGFKNYNQMIGVDTSKKALEIAKKNLQDDKIQFQLMSGEELEFEDCSFDVVSLSNSIHHLEDYSKIFNEIKRVLKPEGMIIFNEMFCDNQSDSQLSHVHIHHFMAEIDTILGITHNPTYKRQEIIDLVKREGLHIIDELDYNRPNTSTKEEDEEEIKALKDLCDKRLKEIEDNEKHSELVKKAAFIKDYFDQYGLDSATQLILITKCG